MKKIFSIILILATLLSFPCLAETSQVSADDETVNLLLNLGCISSESADILSVDKVITRGEFAKIISDVAKLDAQNTSAFSDVPSSHQFYNAVDAVCSNGIMRGDGAGNFNPDKSIVEIDAYVVVLRLLGYEELATYQGGYPTGYLNAARNTKLTAGMNGISLSKEITSNTLSELIKNMLDERIRDISIVKDDGYSKDLSERTFLSIYYGIDKIKGVVTGNTTTTLDRAVENSGLIINRTVLRTDDMSFNGLLGYEAEAYYDRETFILIYAVKTKENNTKTFSSEEIYTVTGRKVICEDNYGKQTEYNIPSDAYIIYNSRASAAYSQQMFNIANGEITFIDNNRDGKTDVVKISSYETLIVDNVNSEENLITFKYNGGSFDKYDLEKTVFYNKNGLSNITWINEYDALDIIKSDTGEVIEIYNSGEVKTKVPVSFDNDTNTNKGYITFSDGVTSAISKNAASRFTNIELNVSYVCSFNKFGQIVAMEKKETGLMAILIAFGEKGIIDKELIAKFYAEDNSLETYKLAEKIILNDYEKDITKETDKQEILTAFATAKGKPVEIEVNPKGEIKKVNVMDVAYNSGSNSVYIYGLAATNVITEGSDAQYLSQNAKAFYIPENYASAEKDYFKVCTTGNIGSALYQPIIAYKKLGSTSPEADALVFVTGGLSTSMPDYDQPAIIEKVTKAYNTAEEVVSSKVTFWYLGSKQTALIAKTELENIIDSGDVAYLDIGDDGMIYGIKKFFDYSDEALTQAAGAIRSKHRAQYGSVFNTYDNLYSVTTDTLNAPNITTTEYIEYHRYPNYGYVYDSARKTVRKAWLSDFVGYESDSDNFSKVFVFTTYMTEYVAVIYK